MLFVLNRRRVRSAVLASLVCALLAGCASAPPDYVTQTKDPWEKLNRVTFAFNQKLDLGVARPVAKTYVRAIPAPARNGVHNFFNNLGEPVTIVNDALQAKGGQTLKDLGRFLINSTFGLLGWFDVARHVGLPDHEEDLGQTLAHWGVPSGPYLVLPVLGPSTLRDAGGTYADYYVNPLTNNMQARYRNAGTVVNGIDTRTGLLSLDSTLDQAFDPYTFLRDAYIQHRRFEIYDGNPPVEYPDYPDMPPDNNSDTMPAAPASTHATPADAHPASGD